MQQIARSLIMLAGALVPALPAMAAPALWEVRDADSAIRIFGSFHILPDGTEWRTPEFDTTLAEADFVVFETDVSAMAMAQLGAQAFARGIYTDGTLLTDRIDAETEALLRAELDKIGMPVGPVLAMRPWMAANAISAAALEATGFSSKGVELALEADLENRPMRFLESGAEQLDVLSAAPEEEQIAMLSSTLVEIDALPKMMSKMLRSWVEGTPERLAPLFQMEMGGFEDAFLDRLLYARNRNWVPALEEMLANDERALVIVGAGHLVGKDNVIALLEAAGYAVERIQ
ncbi:MAG: hypothetical protein ABS76_13610 [Pelagibacterium sp. SCN 64-44]|nr:MAG: hypothetical protein ABS76_13610 [Pelagibacterium sp. SCN 64-44]